jgi:hypothetical protein
MTIFADAWQDATVVKDANPALSGAVNLGKDYEYVQIIIPTLDSSNVSLYVCETVDGTYVPLGLSTNVFAAATGGLAETFKLGGYQFIKILCSAVQTTATRTFRVRGYRR